MFFKGIVPLANRDKPKRPTYPFMMFFCAILNYNFLEIHSSNIMLTIGENKQ